MNIELWSVEYQIVLTDTKKPYMKDHLEYISPDRISAYSKYDALEAIPKVDDGRYRFINEVYVLVMYTHINEWKELPKIIAKIKRPILRIQVIE